MGHLNRPAAWLIGVLLIRARGLCGRGWRLIAGPWRGRLRRGRRADTSARGGGPWAGSLLGALRNIPL
ncbi:MAG TPA: hypothetical protein VM536_18180 [Chloroflexia bacterium]|nr:hypothetical protein [Chloroflexia bacterium]